MTFHEKLARLIECSNREALARKAGLARGTFSRLLDRGQTPSPSAMLRIARVLGVSVEWLIDDDQQWPPVRVDCYETSAA